MTHGSLFSGMGGFDLAAEWMGWENVFHCEKNEFCQKILKYYWPEAKSYEDITKTDFSIWKGRIDILSGGFPCQPYSVAGKRKGKQDERHLWPEMLRAIQEITPPWIVGENVRGLINWNGGMVFEEVQADLEAEGYEVQPFLLPACSINAPHRRDRIWFVAYSDNNRNSRTTRENENESRKERLQERNKMEQSNESSCLRKFSSNSNSSKQQGKFKCKQREEEFNRRNSTYYRTRWEEFPTQTPICNGDDGISSKLDTITFPKWRTESISAGGNAIVPQVALQIFKAIEDVKNKIIWTT